MSKTTMATMLILAVAMLTAATVWDNHRHPVASVTPVQPMPADGTLPPLPPPIEVGPWHIGPRP